MAFKNKLPTVKVSVSADTCGHRLIGKSTDTSAHRYIGAPLVFTNFKNKNGKYSVAPAPA